MGDSASVGPKILLIVPPNITYEAFSKPTKNTKTWMYSSGLELGVIITCVDRRRSRRWSGSRRSDANASPANRSHKTSACRQPPSAACCVCVGSA